MINRESDSERFEALSRELLNRGVDVRFEARGASMFPCIHSGQIVHVTPVIVGKLRKGDIVLTKGHSGFRVHRLVVTEHSKNLFITRGDCGQQNDPPVRGDQILGVVVAKEVRLGKKLVRTELRGIGGKLLRGAAHGQALAGKVLAKARLLRPSPHARNKTNILLGALTLIFILLAATSSRAQVAVDTDPSTSGSADLAGTGTKTLTFTHSTSATANRALLVGVAINIAKSTTAAVSGITYNGLALTFVGAHNDAGNTRRVEMWYQLNPAAGTNVPIVVSVDIPSAATVGVVAGATVFTDVDQTVPLGSFVSADGAPAGCVASTAPVDSQCNSQLNLASVVNGMVFDTLATGLSTVTVDGPQVSQWNATTGGATPNASQDVTSTASSRAGAPSVPLSESLNEVLNLTSVAAAAGGTTVYTGTITGGTGNGFAGDSFTMAGFNSAANNGTFTCNTSTATTLTCSNTAGVKQNPATATATTNSTFTWSQGGISINPSAADIAVTTSVGSAVFVGSTTTYTITVSNNGTSTANGVTLSDTLASGMTLGTVSGTAGGTCVTTTNPITCNIGTLAPGATATVIVPETASAAGSYPNTATVSDSGTPPDPNTGNNTYVAVATVQLAACATVSQATTGTNLTGTLNTYYPGTASVVAGATSIPVGAATGAGTAIAAGNLLLIIQMQDASINASNTVAYGNGSTGQGFTALNSAGDYEFVTAQSAVPATGGTVTIAGAGVGGGTVFAYHHAAVSATAGQSTYQVIVVPQYTSASFNATTPPTALAWNGSTGGVLVMDTSSTLTLNGATVSVNGLGFRGGAGMQLIGSGGANTDYRQPAPTAYTGAVGGAAGWDANKAEGIAGTPAWVESGTTFLATGTGYPSGTAGTDGSMARGAPGNAGAGATDGDPEGTNDQNAGGGGGANGGAGGFGGDTWDTNLSDGGEGGTAFPATINRVALGGGGGAGTRNNSDGDNQASAGASGGGIIIIRTFALSGTATLTANGNSAYNDTANDGGGGGGAGGSIVVLSANGGEGGLTLQANGGIGGDAWQAEPFSLGNRHGPGGGGGGGVLLVSGAPASSSVSGAASGLTENPGVPYGATAGAAGTVVTNAIINQTSGTQSGAQCTPDMTLAKSHVGNFVRGSTATYTIPVENLSPYGSSSGVVTVNDTLPAGLTPISASGTGWSCSIASQTVSCVDPTVLAASSFYPSITVTANVLQTAPAVETNTAMVSGGGEINLSNDTATDVANVVSTADLSVTNAASPNPVAAGSNITYTQVLTNNGPSAADNATLSEATPTGTVFISLAVPTGWNCTTPSSGSSGNIVCTDLNMAGSTAATFILVTRVNPGTASGTVITDTVTTSSSVTDPNTNNNTASASTVVGTTTGGELTVTNVASPNPVVAGGSITYTQVVTNTGTGAATGATFSEATPANTTFGSITATPAGWTCTSPPVSCSNPSVAAGSSGTFMVVYNVSATATIGTVITDIATVNAGNQAFGSNSAVATDVVATSSTQADVALSTSSTPASVYAGNDITYIQTITNNGPAAATGVGFLEAVPTNTTFASISVPAGWSCTTPAVGATGNISCTGPTSMASGTSANIVVVVNVPSNSTATSIVANSSISSTTTDPNSANNSTSISTPVVAFCDLAVTNSGTPATVEVGGTITYTQTVTNSGPSACSTVSFNESIPTNTTFLTYSGAPAGWSCTSFATGCTIASFAPGASSTFTVEVTVNAGTASGTIITDTDTVTTTTHDTNAANNSATVTTVVAGAGQADLSVTNSASPNPVSAGSNITYTQTVTNGGPASATGTVTFTEALPAGTTAVSLNGPAGWTCSVATLTCTIPTLTVSTANFTFVVTVSGTATAGSTITQTDSVSCAASDPSCSNNTASASVVVADSAGLSVTNVNSPIPVLAGGTITYTQVVTNSGPSTAVAAKLTESTPANTTYSSIGTLPTGWSCTTPAVGASGSITCTNLSFAAGSATFTIAVKVSAAAVPGTVISDLVSVSSSTPDPNTNNNAASATDIVAGATQADFITTNVASPTSVAAGGNITFTQGVTNNGPSAATTPTFTQTTPPNTTLVSITPPAGWTCSGVLPGGTGTITCTATTLALSATANFSLILQVNSNTANGTTISDTVTASASNAVPNQTTNSATATAVVATNGADTLSIVKTASSSTVASGDLLLYTLKVTNGTSTATNVLVTDPLPSDVTYQSNTTSTGTCSEAGGTVTCQLGTMTSGATATITIVTLAGAPGIATNTATVSADPPATGNSSTIAVTITAATNIKLESFTANFGKDKTGAERVVLHWKTGGESHNLGFNIYREQSGERIPMNSSLIAGSALLMNGALPKHSGRTYSWIDSSSNSGSAEYWLEDVDVNGIRTLHGPISPAVSTNSEPASDAASATMNQLNQSQPAATLSAVSHPVENVSPDTIPTAAQHQKQFELAAHPALKLLVKREGWYCVTQPELIKDGLDPNVDPSLLHLYAEAIEQAIQITGATTGPGAFGPNAAICFYGTGIDTPYSGTRVYFLETEDSAGMRIYDKPLSAGSNQPPSTFPYTVELVPRTTYFAALTTSNGNNFFGPLVSTTAVDNTVDVHHLDTLSTQSAQLEVILQGVIVAFPHDVTIALNGTTLGDLTFTGQAQGKFTIDLPPGVLQNATNTVTLTAQNGEYDLSLVQSIQITYPHTFQADSDILTFTGLPGEEIKITGFTQPGVTFVDITNPDRPVQLGAQVAPDAASKTATYSAEVQVPWSTTNPAAPASHTLLALANYRITSVSEIVRNHPTTWHSAQPGSEVVMISPRSFASALKPLLLAHQAQQKSSTVVWIDDLYDEFNFGENSPAAIRSFLQTAVKAWHTAPRYLLLNGRASLDPRNYLGFGDLDFVPTEIISTTGLMTASDDWFSDFTDTGLPTIATGRLPVSTAAEAELVAGRIAAYEGQSTNGPWTSQALIVADVNDTENFTKDSRIAQAQLPSALKATDVFTTTTGPAAARQAILDAINSGQLLVNYAGHGSEDEWSGDDIFDSTAASSLTNGNALPVFLIMDCLNGFFQDVYEEPLSVALMLAPNGGAVAVLSSSGLNQASPQTILDKLVVKDALSSPPAALGDAILKAKAGIVNLAVRKTYNLLGDPAMQIKVPKATPSN